MYKKVAAIYDIHGNDSALEAVIKEILAQEVDLIVVGGDVAWGPEPAAVLKRLHQLDCEVRFVRGNADREVGERYGVEQGLDVLTAEINQWCTDQLSNEEQKFLANLPEWQKIEIEGLGTVLFVHGSPRSDEEAISVNTPEEELKPMFEGIEPFVIVCGHTHIQFDRKACGKRIVNPGSVGLPFGTQAACWALFSNKVELKKTFYDINQAVKQIECSGMPHAGEFAVHILNPPSKGP
ncbi:metallophosphoesterase family protein [Thermoflavimicrobium daqui]|jgi:putative phosphoesterase|uniref:Phosphoesterase n=1 Tax=Thermoflavimicrobium daqui TaxID=2137476 RepID=A0A364K4P0_9BACL|nr:metallophosphoesterase family protein [Thermoflavimicrobium daqui]RAL24229.1 metallophosphoesterase [Thermoflavimicrobium daqui]